jgi:hypothetical protein
VARRVAVASEDVDDPLLDAMHASPHAWIEPADNPRDSTRAAREYAVPATVDDDQMGKNCDWGRSDFARFASFVETSSASKVAVDDELRHSLPSRSSRVVRSSKEVRLRG